MAFNIKFKPSVEKDLSQLPKSVVARVITRTENLKSDPFPRQAIKLEGAERLYRIRVGSYRVVYEIELERKIITIHYIRHRREVYRGFEILLVAAWQPFATS